MSFHHGACIALLNENASDESQLKLLKSLSPKKTVALG